MSKALQDVRFAIRQLRKSPGFAFTAMLGLGIGATTAAFSLFNAVLLRQLPFPEPAQLVSLEVLSALHRGGPAVPSSISYPDFFDWRTQAKSFSSIASYHNVGFTLAADGGGAPRHIAAEVVSADFFRVLGVAPEVGRWFTADEEKAGNRSVIITDGLWQSEFNRSPAALGQTIRLGEEPYTVVGVMPAGFSFPVIAEAPAVWTTLAIDAEGKTPQTVQRGWQNLQVVARLKPGVSIEHARGEMNNIEVQLANKYPDSDSDKAGVKLRPQLEQITSKIGTALRILFVAVCFLLLIACTNVAALLLTRVNARGAEMAVRSALGATRAAIIRQLLIESVTLSLLGGLLGVLIASALVKVSPQLLPQDLPRLNEVSVDLPVLAFAVAVSVLTGVVFGLFPALRISRPTPASALHDGTRSATQARGQSRLQHGLVVAETAIVLVLLVGSGLLIRSFTKLLHVDPGFSANDVLSMRVALPSKRYDDQRSVQFYQQLLAQLRTLPGVESASAGAPVPLSGKEMNISFTILGQPVAPGMHPDAEMSVVEPGFFETLQIPLIKGRLFTAQDDQPKSARTVIVNQAFAAHYFPGQNPTGKFMKPDASTNDNPDKDPPSEIIGVTGDVRRTSLGKAAEPEYYVLYGQIPLASPSILLRARMDPGAETAAVKNVLARIDPDLAVYRVHTVADFLAISTAQQRFETVLLSAFAGIALLLAAVGLYGVLAYSVVQRTTEIGIRMALGAPRREVLCRFMVKGLQMTAVGTGIGVVAAAVLTRYIASLLYATEPLDIASFSAAAITLLLVALVASALPARRAASVEPMKALRAE